MKSYKRILLLLSAAVMMLSSGCGSSSSASDSSESSKADSSSSAQSSSAAESSSKTDDSSKTEKSNSPESGFAMKVNKSDGKLNISRSAAKNTPMGDKGKWTIFVYLCGTDLESSGQGSATSDIAQMLEAEQSDNVRFVVQTGGTSKWVNEQFKSDKCERYLVQNQDIKLIESTDLANMGDPSTLSGFLKWGVEKYASEKMGVIFWDHGGGSISGACVDELNSGDTLTLSEINTAFSDVYSGMTDQFEFIGFDCCLMGTAETANILASYARYFYGSQECEPGSGWDYTTFGTHLAKNPTSSGADLGKAIADSFYKECEQGKQANGCTLTIIDLTKFDAFVTAFNDYSKELFEKSSSSFAGIVRGVTSADNFGGNNKSEGYTNMVDIGGIVQNCNSIADGSKVLQTLKDCIVYNKNGSNHAKASGLSVYYPLSVQDDKELRTFSAIAISPYYLSLVDRIIKGPSDSGYTNDSIFNSDGEWANSNCDTSTEDSYFDSEGASEPKESKLIKFAAEPAVNSEGSYSFKLDADSLENAASVSAYIYMHTGEKTIELGETNDVIIDWETGTFSDNFDGYWFALPDGSILSTYIAEITDEYTVYTAPIKLNGKRTNLRLRVDSSNMVEIEGAWDGIGENGAAARDITEIKAGDKISAVHYLLDRSEYAAGEYTWEAGDDVDYAQLKAGDYLYGFSIDDVYGDYFITDPVVFSTDGNGTITFKQ